MAAAVELLERDVKFMTFFYQHLTCCPPHGPFRLYSAITFVERARRRFSVDYVNPSSCAHEGGGGGRDCKAPKTEEGHDGPGQASGDTGEASAMDDGGDALLPSSFASANAEASSVWLCERRQLLEALNEHHVLALIEKRYDTTHLCGWPLMYVPAEVHVADVTAVMERQQGEAARRAKP